MSGSGNVGPTGERVHDAVVRTDDPRPVRRTLSNDLAVSALEESLRKHIIADASNRGDMSMPLALLYSAAASATFHYFGPDGEQVKVTRVVVNMPLP